MTLIKYQLVTLPLLTSILLLLSTYFKAADFLIWFGLIPLFILTHGIKSSGKIIGAWFLAGFALHLMIFNFIGVAANNYFDSTSVGLFICVFYCTFHALSFILIITLYRMLRVQKYPAFNPVILASVWVFVWSIYPAVIPINLVVSLAYNPLLIQGVDVFGPLGADFLIVLVNATLASQWLLWRRSKLASRPNQAAFWTALVLFIAWVGYGYYALSITSESNSNTSTNLTVGFIQPNLYPGIEQFDANSIQPPSIHAEKKWSLALADSGSELIIWPEGHSYWYQRPKVAAAFKQFVQDELKKPLLFTDYLIRDRSALFYYENTYVYLNQYGDIQNKHVKSKGFPGIEQLPFQDAWYDAYNDLGLIHPGLVHMGDSQSIFKYKGISIIPVICYEIMHREYIVNRTKQADKNPLIVVGSQLHWFNSEFQVDLQNRLIILRAVENRTQVLSINYNGGSMHVNASGHAYWLTDIDTRGDFQQRLSFPEHLKTALYQQYQAIIQAIFYSLFFIGCALISCLKLRETEYANGRCSS